MEHHYAACGREEQQRNVLSMMVKQQEKQDPATPSNGNSSSMYQSIDLDAEEISWIMTPAPDLHSKSSQATGSSHGTSSLHQRQQYQQYVTPSSRPSSLDSPCMSLMVTAATNNGAAMSNSLEWVTSGERKPLLLPPSAAYTEQQQDEEGQQQQKDAACKTGAPAARDTGLSSNAPKEWGGKGKQVGIACREDSALEGGACKGGWDVCEGEVVQCRGQQQSKRVLKHSAGLEDWGASMTPVSGSSASQGTRGGGGADARAARLQDTGRQGSKEGCEMDVPETAVSRAGAPAGLMQARQSAWHDAQMDALTPVQGPREVGGDEEASGYSDLPPSEHVPSPSPFRSRSQSHSSLQSYSHPSQQQQHQGFGSIQAKIEQQQGGSGQITPQSPAEPSLCASLFQFQHTNPLAKEHPSSYSPNACMAAVSGQQESLCDSVRAVSGGHSFSCKQGAGATPSTKASHNSRTTCEDTPDATSSHIGSTTSFSWNVLFGDDGSASVQATPINAHRPLISIGNGADLQQLEEYVPALSPVLNLCNTAVSAEAAGSDSAADPAPPAPLPMQDLAPCTPMLQHKPHEDCSLLQHPSSVQPSNTNASSRSLTPSFASKYLIEDSEEEGADVGASKAGQGVVSCHAVEGISEEQQEMVSCQESEGVSKADQGVISGSGTEVISKEDQGEADERAEGNQKDETAVQGDEETLTAAPVVEGAPAALQAECSRGTAAESHPAPGQPHAAEPAVSVATTLPAASEGVAQAAASSTHTSGCPAKPDSGALCSIAAAPKGMGITLPSSSATTITSNLAEAAAVCALGARVAQLVRANHGLEEQVAAMHLQLAAADEEQQWQAQQLADAEAARDTARSVAVQAAMAARRQAEKLEEAVQSEWERANVAAVQAEQQAAEAEEHGRRAGLIEGEEERERLVQQIRTLESQLSVFEIKHERAKGVGQQQSKQGQLQKNMLEDALEEAARARSNAEAAWAALAAHKAQAAHDVTELKTKVDSLAADLRAACAAQDNSRVQLAAKEGSIQALQNMLTDLQASNVQSLQAHQHSPSSRHSSPSPSSTTRAQATQLVELRMCVDRMQHVATLLSEEVGCDAGGLPALTDPAAFAGAGAASDSWASGTLEGLSARCRNVASVLRACVSLLAPHRLVELDDAEGGQMPTSSLAAALAETQGYSKQEEDAGYGAHSLVSGATAEAVQELRARCGEYEKTVARLQERLGEAIHEAETAKQQLTSTDSPESRWQQHGSFGATAPRLPEGGPAWTGFKHNVAIDAEGCAMRKSLEALLQQLAGHEVLAVTARHEQQNQGMPASTGTLPSLASGNGADGWPSSSSLTRAAAAAGSAKPSSLTLAEALQLVEATCTRKQAAEVLLLEAEQRIGLLQQAALTDAEARAAAELRVAELASALEAKTVKLERLLAAAQTVNAPSSAGISAASTTSTLVATGGGSNLEQPSSTDDAGNGASTGDQGSCEVTETGTDMQGRQQGVAPLDAEGKAALQARVEELTAALEAKTRELESSVQTQHLAAAAALAPDRAGSPFRDCKTTQQFVAAGDRVVPRGACTEGKERRRVPSLAELAKSVHLPKGMLSRLLGAGPEGVLAGREAGGKATLVLPQLQSKGGWEGVGDPGQVGEGAGQEHGDGQHCGMACSEQGVEMSQGGLQGKEADQEDVDRSEGGGGVSCEWEEDEEGQWVPVAALQRLLQGLKRVTEEVAAQHEAACEKVDALRRERAQLQHDVGSLRRDKEAAEQTLKELEFKQSGMQQHQEWVQQQLEEVQSRNAALEDELESLQQQHDQVVEQLEDLQEHQLQGPASIQAQELKQAYDDIVQQLAEEQQQQQHLQQQLQEAQALHTQVQRHLQERQQQHEEVVIQLQVSQQRQAEAAQELSRMQQYLEEAGQKLEEAEAAQAAAESIQAEAEREVKEAQGEVQALQQQLAAVNERCTVLEREVGDSSATELADLQQQLASAQARATHLEKEVGSHATAAAAAEEVTDLQQQLAAAHARVKELERQMAAVHESAQEAGRQGAAAASEVQALKQELAATRERFKAAEREASSRVASAAAELRNLQHKLALAHKRSAAVEKRLTDKVGDLQQQLAASQELWDTVESKVSSKLGAPTTTAAPEVTDLLQQLAAAQECVAALEQQAGCGATRISDLQQQLAAARARVSALEAEAASHATAAAEIADLQKQLVAAHEQAAAVVTQEEEHSHTPSPVAQEITDLQQQLRREQERVSSMELDLLSARDATQSAFKKLWEVRQQLHEVQEGRSDHPLEAATPSCHSAPQPRTMHTPASHMLAFSPHPHTQLNTTHKPAHMLTFTPQPHMQAPTPHSGAASHRPEPLATTAEAAVTAATPTSAASHSTPSMPHTLSASRGAMEGVSDGLQPHSSSHYQPQAPQAKPLNHVPPMRQPHLEPATPSQGAMGTPVAALITVPMHQSGCEEEQGAVARVQGIESWAGEEASVQRAGLLAAYAALQSAFTKAQREVHDLKRRVARAEEVAREAEGETAQANRFAADATLVIDELQERCTAAEEATNEAKGALFSALASFDARLETEVEQWQARNAKQHEAWADGQCEHVDALLQAAAQRYEAQQAMVQEVHANHLAALQEEHEAERQELQDQLEGARRQQHEHHEAALKAQQERHERQCRQYEAMLTRSREQAATQEKGAERAQARVQELEHELLQCESEVANMEQGLRSMQQRLAAQEPEEQVQALQQQLAASMSQQHVLEQLLEATRTQAQRSKEDAEAEITRVRAEATRLTSSHATDLAATKQAAQQEVVRLQAMAMPESLWTLLQQLEVELTAKGGRDSSRSSQSDLAAIDQRPSPSPMAKSPGWQLALGLGLMQGQTPDALMVQGGVGRAAEAVVQQAVLVLRTLREQNRKMGKVLSRISREGSIVHQLEAARAENKDLLCKYTATQLSVQQLQRAMQRLSAENDNLVALLSKQQLEQPRTPLQLGTSGST